MLLQVVVAGERRSRYFHLTNSLKKVGKYVGRGNRKSIARAVIGNPNLRHHVVQAVAREVRREIKELCSRKYDTILRMTTKPALENFTWERVLDELERKAPTLLSIIRDSLPKKKAASEAARPAICTCASILLKMTNPHVNLVQGVLSVVLRAGRASTQV